MKLLLTLFALFCTPALADQFYTRANVSATHVSATYISSTFQQAGNISSSGNVSANKFIGDGSLLTGIGVADWYDLTGVPAQIQRVSNSGYLEASGLGVTGAITATTVSASANVFTLNTSTTTLYLGGQQVIWPPSWYVLGNIPAGLQNISTTALATAELSQLQNIDTAVIANTQWTRVQHLNQSVSSTATPSFAGMTINGLATVSTASVTANLFAASVSATELLVTDDFAVDGQAAFGGIISTSLSGSGTETACLNEDGQLERGTCGGGGGGGSWYDLSNIPTYVRNVSNSTYLAMSGIGVTGTVTATTLSGTALNGRYASVTTLSASGISTTIGGIVSASYFEGDGSRLTGISGGGSSGPAFVAYMVSTSQYISPSVFTKVAFGQESYDPDSVYDTTNRRFTPNKAGLYQVNAGIRLNDDGTAGWLYLWLYKNGSSVIQNSCGDTVWPVGGESGVDRSLHFSCLIWMNGSTDYLEAYGRQDTGVDRQIRESGYVPGGFSAHWVRD